MDIGERVKKVRNESGLTLEAFGERLGVTAAAISRIENGKRALTDQAAKVIAQEFGISEEWLKTGTGPMRTITADGIAAEVAEMLHLSDWGTKALERFLRLDSDDQRQLLRILEELFGPFDEADDEIEAAARAAGDAAAAAKRAELLDRKKVEDA